MAAAATTNTLSNTTTVFFPALHFGFPLRRLAFLPPSSMRAPRAFSPDSLATRPGSPDCI